MREPVRFVNFCIATFIFVRLFLQYQHIFNSRRETNRFPHAFNFKPVEIAEEEIEEDKTSVLKYEIFSNKNPRIIEKTEEEKSVELFLARRETMLEKACKYQKFIDSLSKSNQNVEEFLKFHEFLESNSTEILLSQKFQNERCSPTVTSSKIYVLPEPFNVWQCIPDKHAQLGWIQHLSQLYVRLGGADFPLSKFTDDSNLGQIGAEVLNKAIEKNKVKSIREQLLRIAAVQSPFLRLLQIAENLSDIEIMGQVKELSQDPGDKLSAIFWILANKVHSQDMKEKWKEQHQKCVPCEIRYKYIVHQTDEQNIINTVYGEIAATGTTEGPERTLPDENEELLATVDRSALELVYKRFFGDFVYFGFSSSYVRKILTASKYRKNDEIWAEKLNEKTDSEADYLSCL